MIRSVVHPIVVFVLHDDEVACGDIKTTIFFMEERRRNFIEIDIVVAVDVFEDGAFFNPNRINHFKVFDAVSIGFNYIEIAAGIIESESYDEAAGGIHGA